MVDSVPAFLDQDPDRVAPETADTAIFYSISSAQRGLDGISFGDFLIKRVVGSLSDEFTTLKSFAAVSPLPGFSLWYDAVIGKLVDTILLSDEKDALVAVLPENMDAETMLRQVLTRSDWVKEQALADALQPILTRLASTYLYTAKRRGTRAMDPVAHFHLSNGARMERLNWLADRSPRGMQQSAGMMINYLSKLDGIDTNQEGYKGEGSIAVSPSMRSLARKSV